MYTLFQIYNISKVFTQGRHRVTARRLWATKECFLLSLWKFPRPQVWDSQEHGWRQPSQGYGYVPICVPEANS